MTCRLTALEQDARDPARLAAFWSALLGRTVVGGTFLPGSPTQVGLRFVAGRTVTTHPERMHLHVGSTTGSPQDQVVAEALDLGARHLDVGQLPEELHVVLADPEGNEFCVIEEQNTWLAGCGRLGEVTCAGTREVGFFWAAALGWPLVWDQGGETAVQAPAGGTKLSWGGPPLPPKPSPNRQRFALTVPEGDLEDEVERLVGLGATRLGSSGAVVELRDPDGNEFLLTL